MKCYNNVMIINVMIMILSLNSGVKILNSCDFISAFYIKQSGHHKNKHGFFKERSFLFIYCWRPFTIPFSVKELTRNWIFHDFGHNIWISNEYQNIKNIFFWKILRKPKKNLGELWVWNSTKKLKKCER